jgi:hypothetical protein
VTKGTFNFDAAFRAPVGDLIESVEERKRRDHSQRHPAIAIGAQPRCWKWGMHKDSFRPTLLRCEVRKPGLVPVMNFRIGSVALTAARSLRDSGATSYIAIRPNHEAYGRGFPWDIKNAATLKQIAIPKVAVYKGNHIWRYCHIWRPPWSRQDVQRTGRPEAGLPWTVTRRRHGRTVRDYCCAASNSASCC